MQDFIKNQSKEHFNPIIDWSGSTPIYLLDKIYEDVETSYHYSNWYRYTVYDYELKQFVCHTYAVNKTVKRGIRIQEIMREFETYPSIWRNAYYVSWGCNSGFHAVWNKSRTAYYYECEVDEDWDLLPEYLEEKGVPTYAYEMSYVEQLIASDLSLQYFAWKPESRVHPLKYIRLYRKYPIAEMVMKLELYRFALNEKALKTITENKTFRKWLFKNYKECQGLAFKTCFNSFKKNPSGSVSDYYNSLMYRIFCGKEIAKGNHEQYEYILQYTTQEKLYEYLNKNNIKSASYFDYVEAARWLQLNFEDTKILYPNNFQEVHDDYTKQYGDWKNRVEAMKHPEISDGMLIVAKKYQLFEYQGEEYSIINARSKLDLIEESSALAHCVGRMGYDLRQVEEESLICFLRKNEELDKPYVTIELDLKNYQIKQCYGIHNSRVIEVEPFKEEWLKHVKKQVKKLPEAWLLI